MIREATVSDIPRLLNETYDPAIVNGFAQFVLGEESDLSAGIRLPNVFLFGEHGGICLGYHPDGSYEAHIMFTLAGRGRWGIEAGREAVSHMAARGVRHIWARVHPDKPEVAVYACAVGLRDTGQTHEMDIGDGPVRWRIFEWRF